MYYDCSPVLSRWRVKNWQPTEKGGNWESNPELSFQLWTSGWDIFSVSFPVEVPVMLVSWAMHTRDTGCLKMHWNLHERCHTKPKGFSFSLFLLIRCLLQEISSPTLLTCFDPPNISTAPALNFATLDNNLTAAYLLTSNPRERLCPATTQATQGRGKRGVASTEK